MGCSFYRQEESIQGAIIVTYNLHSYALVMGLVVRALSRTRRTEEADRENTDERRK